MASRHDALNTLRQAQALPHRDTWQSPPVEKNPGYPCLQVFQGEGAFEDGGGVLQLNSDGSAFSVGVSIRVEVPPSPGQESFKKHFGWYGRLNHTERSDKDEFYNSSDPELMHTPLGFRAIIHTVGSYGLLLGCWPSGRTRVWCVDSSNPTWPRTVPFDKHIKPSSRHALELNGSVAALLERDGAGTVSLTTFDRSGH